MSPTAVDPLGQCPASTGGEKTGICTMAARLRSSPGASETIFSPRNSPCEIRGLGDGGEAVVAEDASLDDVAPPLPRAVSADDQEGPDASIAPAASAGGHGQAIAESVSIATDGNENGEGANLLRAFEASIRDAHVGIEEEVAAASSVEGVVPGEEHAAAAEAGASLLLLAEEAAISYVEEQGGGMAGGDVVANAADGLALLSEDTAAASAAEGGRAVAAHVEQLTLEKIVPTDDAAAASSTERGKVGGGKGCSDVGNAALSMLALAAEVTFPVTDGGRAWDGDHQAVIGMMSLAGAAAVSVAEGGDSAATAVQVDQAGHHAEDPVVAVVEGGEAVDVALDQGQGGEAVDVALDQEQGGEAGEVKHWTERARLTDWSCSKSIAKNFPHYKCRKRYGRLVPPRFMIAQYGCCYAKAKAVAQWRRMTQDQQKVLKQQYVEKERQQRKVDAGLAKIERARLRQERSRRRKLAQDLLKRNEKAAKASAKEAQAAADAPAKEAHARVLRKARDTKRNALRKQKREESKMVRFLYPKCICLSQ